MSLTRQLAGNTLAQIFSKMLGTILGVVSIMIMARYLGAEKFGWYATAIGFFQFVFLMADGGFTLATSSMLSEKRPAPSGLGNSPSPLLERGGDDDAYKRRIFNTLFSWRLVTAIIAQIAGAILIWFFPYNETIKFGALIISGTFLLLAVNQVFVGYFQSRLSTYILSAAEIIFRLLLIIGLFGAAYFNLGFYSTLLAILFANLIYTIIIWPRKGAFPPFQGGTQRGLPSSPTSATPPTPSWKEGVAMPRLCFDKEISRLLFVKIWPMTLAVILNGVYLQGDRLLLPLFVPQTDVGFYGAAYRVLDILTQAAAIIAGLLLPLLTFSWSRNEPEEFKKRFQWIFDLSMLLILPMTLGTLALSGPIMNFVGGTEFAGAGKILGLLSIAAFGISFGMAFGHVALSMNKQKQALWIYGSDACLSLIGYLIFIPKFGMYGAAYVTIFSEFYAGIGLLLLCRKYAGVLPRFGKFLKILIASIIMALLIKILPPIHILLQVFFGAVIYTALILSLGAVSKETLRDILK